MEDMSDRRVIKGHLYGVVANVIRASETSLTVPDLLEHDEVQAATQHHAQPSSAVRRQVINLLHDGLIESVGPAKGGVQWKEQR